MSKKKKRDIPLFESPIFETHCHLDYLDTTELESTLTRARAVGVKEIVTIAVSADNLDKVMQLTRADDHIYGSQGIHPHEAEQWNTDICERIRDNAADEKILAIGEIGLDYFYDHADRKIQRQVFEQQLQIAVDLKLPVVIHTREADEDTRSILENFSGSLAGNGVIHSFTSGIDLAQFCLGEGFKLGFNGITTFNRADNVREVVRATPVEQIVLETDAPYLTPVPYRGRPNAPFYLPFIAETLAELKSQEIETFLAQTYRNSKALFAL